MIGKHLHDVCSGVWYHRVVGRHHLGRYHMGGTMWGGTMCFTMNGLVF